MKMGGLLHSCWVQTVPLDARHLGGHPCLPCSSMCRLEEISPETLKGVGGIVKATAELSFCFKSCLLAHLSSFARSVGMCPACLHGVTLLTALLVKDLSNALSDAASSFGGLNVVCFLQRERLCPSTWLWSPCLDYVSLNLSGELHTGN